MKRPDVTLPDGQTFAAGSVLPRIFEAVQAQHLANLRRISTTDGRREYLANVDRSEGIEAGRALREAYMADRDARRGTK